MCGIVGYCGDNNATEIILNGLEKLEYRGYDSAGISIIGTENINTLKRAGKLQNLVDAVNEAPFDGKVGIGHTRWATHGIPTETNAHPHINKDGSISVVHNGIIENFVELKEKLISEGYSFKSETDTEVIAHLIDKFYDGNLLNAVLRTLKELEGSYAICAIANGNPSELIAARNKSPLLLGVTPTGNIVASDAASIVEHTQKVIYLDDEEIVHLKLGKDPVVYNLNLDIIEKEISQIDWDVEAASKEGFEHYMIKEIFEQERTVSETLERLVKDNTIDLGDNTFTKEEFENFENIYVTSCGTALHAGQVGKFLIEKLIRVPVRDEIASEFAYSDPFVTDQTLVIVVSQSGETADTLNAIRLAKKRGATVYAITNVVGSTIAREADKVLYCHAGPEISVASTKAYTSQVTNLYLFALDWALKIGKISQEELSGVLTEIHKVPEMIKALLKECDLYKSVSQEIINAESVYFIGRGVDYITSKEASLKLKEISYIHSESFPAGELKHGTIALIEEDTKVFALATQRDLIDKMVSNIQEISARGAEVFAIGFYNEGLKKHTAQLIEIPEIDDFIAPLISIVPLQIIAYYASVLKGNDVDKPRNLAKSVTVE
ncbi:glucosamine--fructose-6-phosphate aminotransferase (isomerizing) [Peptoniphilus asaccharolyticus DSM 20463]|uniref:Glutamine--fructose-6-phosphate aminotransferase [isomerizing] n=1 Tax=Peptoniphilus asaccharolyticus DSM 20463 TaxID=573058 RepID=A0A1W1UQZ3_PEPAS|nr:glutamine--fructose-6-phosphate transaminase (isomerizing) [Peptoniphilus asaccharolyticus]MBL7575020.1 glutamine--fructose-6-phosphate transaminase (isomerizing) [Peptoniphilus asaccharolyticus]SMB83231.1 glucosamine--fructose-6-phosphate aminotransferase (isomerizing) [Peptoniphilus asaccharolyticus DSM 20463]